MNGYRKVIKALALQALKPVWNPEPMKMPGGQGGLPVILAMEGRLR